MESLERMLAISGLVGVLAAACSGTVEVIGGNYNIGPSEDAGMSYDASDGKDSGNENCYTCSCENSCKRLINCDPGTTEPANNAAMCTSHCESGNYKVTTIDWFKCVDEQCYEGMGDKCADYLPD
ncbi:MAG: hypothetical protein AB1668_04820 [Nanoarchaeota archaeon]